MAFSPADVRAYYDANTEAFVRHGQGGHLGAIHRAVWGPGAISREQAFRYVENLILGIIDTLTISQPPHIVDLGCGIGASLTYLAGERPLRGTGVTVSPVQVRLGRERIDVLGLSDRVQIIEADYNALPDTVEPADVAYAIESFVHGPSPAAFFTEAARILKPGGRLIVCDDVLSAAGNQQASRTIALFERGWHVNALLAPEEWQSHARHAGLRHDATVDLTPYLELGRPRDRLFTLLAAVAARSPVIPRRLAPLVGGAALQRGLANGWISHHFAQFQRV